MLGIGPPRTENHYVSRTAPLRFVEPASLSSGVGSVWFLLRSSSSVSKQKPGLKLLQSGQKEGVRSDDWGPPMRLFVVVHGDEIVVTSETGFRAAYCKRPNFPQLKVRRCTDTDDYELLAQAWQAANAKARELGWIT